MMTYKIDAKNLKGSYTLANLLLLVAFFFTIIVDLAFVPPKVLELICKEKVEAVDEEVYYSNDSYHMKLTYYVDEKEYEYTVDDFDTDDKHNKTLYYKKGDPELAVSQYEIDQANENMFLLCAPVALFIISTIIRIINWSKVAKVRRLCYKGVLVKNIPYRLVSTDFSLDGKTIMAFCINYTFPDGITKELVSTGIYKDVASTGLCDLLYDPKNFNNYYIDTNIRVTGQGNPVVIHYQ